MALRRTLLNCSFSPTAYPTCFPLTQFTCNNGRCININWRCDNGKSYLLPSAAVARKARSHSQAPDGEGRDLRLRLGLSAGHWNPEGLAREKRTRQKFHGALRWAEGKVLLTLHHFLPPQGRAACLLAGFKGLRKV